MTHKQQPGLGDGVVSDILSVLNLDGANLFIYQYHTMHCSKPYQ